MTELRGHEDLVAWQIAVQAAKDVYALASRLPADERFGLIQQMRRAAVSVPSNIAEGYGRGRSPDFLRFLRMARGSLLEVDTQLVLNLELGYLSASDIEPARERLRECARVLTGLLKRMERRIAERPSS